MFFTWPFFDLQPQTLIFAEEISNLFIIYLQIRHPDQELDVVIGLGNVTEDVGKTVWDDT